MKKGIPGLKLRDLVADIRESTTDVALMERYGLTPEQLSEVLSRLVVKGYMSRAEVDELVRMSLTEQEIEALAEDLRQGFFYEEIEEKYGLSSDDLHETLSLMASRGLVPEEDMRSRARAVNPRDAVRDFTADMPVERFRDKYDLTEEDLTQLFALLVERSYLSANEVDERFGAPAPAEEPHMVPLCGTTNDFEESLVRSVLEDAEINYTASRSLFSTGFGGEPLMFLVEETQAEKAQELLAQYVPSDVPYPVEFADEETDIVDPDSSVDEPIDMESTTEDSTDEDVPDTESHERSDYWALIFGLGLVIFALAYVLGWIKL